MSLPLAVTTSVKPSPETETQAREIAAALNAACLPRAGRSLAEMFAVSDAARLLVVGSDHRRLHDRQTGTEYFYHPNLLLTRGAEVLRGGRDHFLEAVQLMPGDRLLDCTLGFACEAALAALAVGETGTILGLESVPELALLTRLGLHSFVLRSPPLTAALRRVQVEWADSRDYLPTLDRGAFDVVYFDPFFEERLPGSESSVSPLFVFGNPAPLSPEAVREARRVARRRVVIKHPGDAALPAPVPEWVMQTVGSRKSRVVYSIIAAGSDTPTD